MTGWGAVATAAAETSVMLRFEGFFDASTPGGLFRAEGEETGAVIVDEMIHMNIFSDHVLTSHSWRPVAIVTLAQSQLVVDASYEFVSVRIDEDGHSFVQLHSN